MIVQMDSPKSQLNMVGERTSIGRGSPWLLIFITAAIIAPIWYFHYFPTTDGAAHLATADVLLHYRAPEGSTYREYYQLNFTQHGKPFPNAMGHWILAGLMIVFPPLVAEKILVSAIALLTPLAARYALMGVRPAAGWLAYLTVPLTFNYLFHQGFYNFCSSVVVFLFILGYWLRRREDMTLLRSGVMFLLAALLYTCHVFALNMAIVAIGTIAGWFTLLELYPLWKAGELTHTALWKSIRSRCILSGVPLLPAMVLGQRFHFATGFQIIKLWGRNADYSRLASLFQLDILTSYRPIENWVGLSLAAIIIALAAYTVARKLTRRTWNAWDGLLLFPAATLVIFSTHASGTADIYFIPKRLILFFYLGLILWLAAQELPRAIQKLVSVAGLAIAVFSLVLHVQSYAAYDPQIAEYVRTLEKIEPKSTVLPLMFSARGLPAVSAPGPTVFPFYTAAGYAMIERNAVDLRNYEGKEFYFPIRYRDEFNPYEFLALNQETSTSNIRGFDVIPQRFDLNRYTTSTPGRVDYVMVWGVTPELVGHPDTLRAYEQLRAGYEKIYTSSTRRSQLWKRRSN